MSAHASPRVATVGALVFVVSDAITFVALLGAALFLRIGHREWSAGHASLTQLGVLSVLLFAGSAAIAGARRRRRLLVVAAAAALAFVAGESLEWRALMAAQHGPSSDLRHASLFVVTGLHAVHVSVGAVALLFYGLRKASATTVRVLSYYWLALDVAWLGIVGTLYLG